MSERGITRVGGMAVVDEPRPRERVGFNFTDEQRRLIRDSFANGASDAEFEVLMEIAKARRLNPLLRQIHFVSRWDSEKHRPVWAAQVSIDGLRAIAERTGLYAGQDEPEFVHNPDGTLKLCKVRVWRRDWPRPAVGIAYFAEYVQTARDRQTGKQRPTAMWGRMPHVMLAKCSESLALRKAFPEDMSGLYTSEEMGNAPGGWQQGKELPPAPAVVQQQAPARPAPTVVSRVQTRVEERVEVASRGGVESVPVVGVTTVPVETMAANDTNASESGARAVVPSGPRDPWMDYLG